MLIAELRSKLSNIEDLDPEDSESIEKLRSLLKITKEDLLTADVFGTIKYLPRDWYLKSVLEEIKKQNKASNAYEKGLPKLLDEIHQLKFNFWPHFSNPPLFRTSEKVGSTEPDVEISSPGILMFVESKLDSAFGDQQVERELAVAIDQGKGKEFFLVLVTPSASPPHFSVDGKRLPFGEYIRSISKLPHDLKTLQKELIDNSDRVLWISWQRIRYALESAKKKHAQILSDRQNEITCVFDMLDDLWKLMDMRGIRQFKGISSIQSINEDLQSQTVFSIHTSQKHKSLFFPNIIGLLTSTSGNPLLEKLNCRTRGEKIFHKIRKRTISRFLGFSDRSLLLDESINREKNRSRRNHSGKDIKVKGSIKIVDQNRNLSILGIHFPKRLSIGSSRNFGGFLQIVERKCESGEMEYRPAGTQIIRGIKIRRSNAFRGILDICEKYDLKLFSRRIKLPCILSRKGAQL